jgi:hypothetical protein
MMSVKAGRGGINVLAGQVVRRRVACLAHDARMDSKVQQAVRRPVDLALSALMERQWQVRLCVYVGGCVICTKEGP